MFKKLLLKIAGRLVPFWDGHPDNSAKLLIDQMDKMHIAHQVPNTGNINLNFLSKACKIWLDLFDLILIPMKLIIC